MSNYQPARSDRKERGHAHGPYDASSSAGIRSSSSSQLVQKVPEKSPVEVGAGLATLWVGGLLPSVTDDDLFDAFAPFGFVTDVNLSEKQQVAGVANAQVKFSVRFEAEEALIAALNRKVLVKGKNVTCRWAQQDIVNMAQLKSTAMSVAAVCGDRVPERHPNVAGSNYTAPKIWIGNLTIDTTENDMRQICRSFGCELVDAIIHKKPSQYGQLSGFLRFKTLLETETMLKAISSGAMVVRGAVVKAALAKGCS